MVTWCGKRLVGGEAMPGHTGWRTTGPPERYILLVVCHDAPDFGIPSAAAVVVGESKAAEKKKKSARSARLYSFQLAMIISERMVGGPPSSLRLARSLEWLGSTSEEIEFLRAPFLAVPPRMPTSPCKR